MYNFLNETKLGAHRLKNKVIMTSLTTNLSHDNGDISQKDLAFYKERIDGGVGAIITGMMKVDEFYGNKFPYQPSATHSKYIRGMRALTDLCHENDVKIFAQLNHPGAQTFRELNHNLQQISAFAQKPELINQASREMTDYEIGHVISQFVRSAIICEQAGFDGIEIHAGHGYLIHSFLLTDRGNDILIRLIREIRTEVSSDFSIIIRLNFEDFTENGIKTHDAIKTIKYIENEKIDSISLTCGVYESMYSISDAKYYKNRWKDDYIKEIKMATNIPIIANNNIKTHDEASDMLDEGICDFIGLARPLLADPNWVRKASENRKIAPCISCSHCFKTINEFKPVACPINPYLSRESLRDREIFEGNSDKTMVIIGAGPAGLQMAISLKEKGYKVVVFEKDDKIGGKLNIAAKTSDKYRIYDYVDYLKDRVNDLNIDIRLGEIADVETIKNLNPYQVFIATGASDEKLNSDYIYTATDILEKNLKPTNKKILIIGAGENGLEISEVLDKSNQITIVEATNMIGREMEYGERLMLLEKLASKKVEILTDTMVDIVDENKARLKSADGIRDEKYDLIIKTTRPVTDLLENRLYLENLGNPIIIGDADKVGKIYDATSKAVIIASRY